MKTTREEEQNHQRSHANKTINRIENLTSESTGRLAPSPGEITVWPHVGSSETSDSTQTPKPLMVNSLSLRTGWQKSMQ